MNISEFYHQTKNHLDKRDNQISLFLIPTKDGKRWILHSTKGEYHCVMEEKDALKEEELTPDKAFMSAQNFFLAFQHLEMEKDSSNA